MPPIYDLPNATHMERGITGVFEYANVVSDGIFMPMVLLALWAISFIGTTAGLRVNASNSWIFASFLCAVVAVPLAVLGLLNPNFMYLLGLLLAIGVFWRSME